MSNLYHIFEILGLKMSLALSLKSVTRLDVVEDVKAKAS